MGLVYSAGQGCEMQLVYSRSEILFFLRGQPSKKSAEASFYTPLSLDFVTHPTSKVGHAVHSDFVLVSVARNV